MLTNLERLYRFYPSSSSLSILDKLPSYTRESSIGRVQHQPTGFGPKSSVQLQEFQYRLNKSIISETKEWKYCQWIVKSDSPLPLMIEYSLDTFIHQYLSNYIALVIFFVFFSRSVTLNYFIYVHWTINMILLLTEGGTPFDAMHKYDPMCSRLTFVMLKWGPSTVFSAINKWQ